MLRVPLMAPTSFHHPMCLRTLISVCGAVLIIQLLFFTRPRSMEELRHSPSYIPHNIQTPLHSSSATQQSSGLPSIVSQNGNDDQEEQRNSQQRPTPNVTYSGWTSNSSFLLSHGTTDCMPPLSNTTHPKAQATRRSCNLHSPFNLTSLSAEGPRIAVLTAHYGSDNAYDTALQTHLLHGLIHEHEVHVLCDPIVDAIWNKPAFILKLMMEEMMKPDDERLEWIFWADRDTMILDQCRPISSFLPPERSASDRPRPPPTPGFFSCLFSSLGFSRFATAERKDIHLLVSNDKNGLNAGIFLLRVSQTSISLLTAMLSYPTHHPKTRLRFKEQTAMSLLVKTPEFRPHTQIVPQHWFNSYTYMDRDAKGNNRGYHGDEGDIDSGAVVYAERTDLTGLEGGFKEGYVRRGDFLVHFAGNKKKEQNVERWAKILDRESVVWNGKAGVQRDSVEEVARFWKDSGY